MWCRPFPSPADIDDKSFNRLVDILDNASDVPTRPLRTFMETLRQQRCELADPSGFDELFLLSSLARLGRRCSALRDSRWSLTSQCIVSAVGPLGGDDEVLLSDELVASIHGWLTASLRRRMDLFDSGVVSTPLPAVDVAVHKLRATIALLRRSASVDSDAALAALVRFLWYDDDTPPAEKRTPAPPPSSDLPSQPRILLMCTGSVACIKVPQLVEQLKHAFNFPPTVGAPASSRRASPKLEHRLAVVATNTALHFLRTLEDPNDPYAPLLRECPSIEQHGAVERSVHGIPVFTDADEWLHWRRVGDDVLHIELRKQFDVAVIAPLDANTLAKLAAGMSDNLVLSIMRAWEGTQSPVVLAPAMNTTMWNHPLTQRHLDVLCGPSGLYRRCMLAEPVVKRLACGDEGKGAMAALDDIVAAVQSIL